MIYGAGAIGATIGGRLHDAGTDVVLIARGDHLETLRREAPTPPVQPGQRPRRHARSRCVRVPTPVNEALQRVAAAAAREGRSPGSVGTDEVEREIARLGGESI
ncbi:MAG: 2-dehydropantoate 2-reductase N-terminal domain-containing protein [Thermoleophilaceae bacterium]